MDAKICDICGATYLAPVTYREQAKNFEIKRTKFGWMLFDTKPYYTQDFLNICPACSDKIGEFIDTLIERREDHETDGHIVKTFGSSSKRSSMSAEELNWDNLGPDGGPYPYKPYDSFDEFMAETRHQPGYIRTMLYKAYLTGYRDGIAYRCEHS